MRRKSADKFIPWVEYNVLEHVDPNKLELIGAICLEWNFIEDMVDEVLSETLRITVPLRADITSRIYGLEAKTELIKKAVRRYIIFSKAEAYLIAGTIGAINAHRKYRDGVIHARVFDPQSDIALTSPKKGHYDDVLVSEDALAALLERLMILSDEITLVYRLVEPYYFDEWDLKPEGHIDPKKLRTSQGFRDAFAQLQEHQSRRLSLPPLPEFPDPHPTPEE